MAGFESSTTSGHSVELPVLLGGALQKGKAINFLIANPKN
jgi:hypothetical protein